MRRDNAISAALSKMHWRYLRGRARQVQRAFMARHGENRQAGADTGSH